MRDPDSVLFSGEKPLPSLPAVDHYCGSEKLIRKALALQQQTGPVFDITCDCEDGAAAGQEREHVTMCAALIASDDNRFGRAGLRVHDATHPAWRTEIEIALQKAGTRLPYLTLPKARSAADVATQIEFLRRTERALGLQRSIPVHVLIETHGALREVWQIAGLAGVESIDFGLMDFVSDHLGAIPGSAMKSPGQFEHPLLVRAKAEIVAAGLANGVVPTHNVTTELRDKELIRDDARHARSGFGFLRMWSIHPNQIEPILDAFRPDFSETEEAGCILAKAQDADWGPIQEAGRLHDRASFRYYWSLLKRARQTGAALPEPIVSRFFSRPQG
ncbi:MAG TPA: aldolase/citrate lyase family protein [Rhodocyclaceae bacterium]